MTATLTPTKPSAVRKAEAEAEAKAKSAEVRAFDPATHPKEAEWQKTAIAAHKAAQAAAETALEKAHECGEALLKLKEKFAHGEWGDYCKKVLSFSQRTAQEYMKIARNWQEISHCGADSIARALARTRKIVDTQRVKTTPAQRLLRFASKDTERWDAIVEKVGDLSTENQRKKLAEHVAHLKDTLDKLEAALNAAAK